MATNSDSLILGDQETYEPVEGEETNRELNMGDGDGLAEEYGDSVDRTINDKKGAELFVDRYDDRSKAIRELMANAHTACLQRCAVEVSRAGDEDPEEVRRLLNRDVRTLIEKAREIGYEPQIEVSYNRDPESRWTFRLEDNGIGISQERFKTISEIGLSGWEMHEGTNGQFGIGRMSAFLLCGKYGEFKTETHSIRDGKSYAVGETLRSLDWWPDKGLDYYGTRLTFPTFCEEASDIDVASAVEEYAEGMIIPVMYRDFDSDGDETFRSDEYTETFLESLYPDDATTIVYEDEYVKAIWSPESSSSSNHTWCGYQPIDRNDSGWSMNSYEMPGVFDVRVKVENGLVYDADGADCEGRVPIADQVYENEDVDPEKFIPNSEVPSGAIRIPTPTDDRDRFESSHVDDFFEEVSHRLNDEWRKMLGEILDGVDSFDDVLDLAQNDSGILIRGLDRFGVRRYEDTDHMQEYWENEIGVTIDGSVWEKIDVMEDTVEYAPEGEDRATRQSYRTEEPIWKINARDGDVYMASRITTRKMQLAWELGGNVVQVSKSNQDQYTRLFGWKSLHGLPTEDPEVEFPLHDFDDQWLDSWKKSSNSSSGGSTLNTGTGDFDHSRAKQRDVRVRVATGDPSYMATYTGEDLFEKMDDGETVSISYDSYDTLILYDQTDGHSTGAGASLASSATGVAYSVVPSYVYDYLIGAENIVTEEEYIERVKNIAVEPETDALGRSEIAVSEMDACDVIVSVSDETWSFIEDLGIEDTAYDAIRNTTNTRVRSISFVESFADLDELLHRHKRVVDLGTEPVLVGIDRSRNGIDSRYISRENLVKDELLGDLNFDSIEAKRSRLSADDLCDIATMLRLQDAGGFWSTDDDSECPDAELSVFGLSKRRYKQCKTAERLEEAGGRIEDESKARIVLEEYV